MLYELERTTNYRFQYNKLNLRMRRFVDEAIEIIKESPTDFHGKISHMANRKTHNMYRFRVPGAYIIYLVPVEGTVVTLTNIKSLY